VHVSPSLPHLDAYIAALPRGLESHPECQLKGAVVRAILETSPGLVAKRDALPAFLSALLDTPPTHSAWVPEVVGMALQEARRDLLFSSDEAFLADVRVGNEKLLSGMLYGFLFRLVGVPRLMQGASTRWSQMHRGSMLVVTADKTPQTLVVRLEYPVALVSPLAARAMAEVFVAAIHVAGAQDAQVTLLEHNPQRALYRCRW
jgi:hypothetical protein